MKKKIISLLIILTLFAVPVTACSAVKAETTAAAVKPLQKQPPLQQLQKQRLRKQRQQKQRPPVRQQPRLLLR